MSSSLDRRSFLRSAAATGAAIGLASSTSSLLRATETEAKSPLFRISLAEWSFHNALFANEMDNLDFPLIAKRDYGIEGVEYVNVFFKDKAKDSAYLTDLKKRCDDNGVTSVLIMCDAEGDLGDPDDAKRTEAVENHFKWVDAAKFLGCHSIRVNARSQGSYDEQMDRAADGLRRLSEFAAGHDINVIVENHGGLSSNGAWLVGVMKKVDLPNCGTLPDFGNFRISDDEVYDKYKGVAELMPYAKGVSAKSHVFGADGSETEIDYLKMLKIVTDAGYHNWVGIEWEGSTPSEPEGVRLTLALLEKVRKELS